MSDAAVPANYEPAPMGSDPHGRYADQQKIYSDFVENSRAPILKYQPQNMPETDGGVSVGGQPGEQGTL